MFADMTAGTNAHSASLRLGGMLAPFRKPKG